MHNNVNYPVVVNYDDNYFKDNGSFEFLTDDKLKYYKDNKKLINNRYLEVEYSGMGWLLIKKML